MTQEELEKRLSGLRVERDSQRMTLGLALLNHEDMLPSSRRDRETIGGGVTEHRRMIAETEQQIQDAEVMLSALDALDLQRGTLSADAVRDVERTFKAQRDALKNKVSLEEYEVERNRFLNDYPKLMDTKELMDRARKLYSLAKRCSNTATNDLLERFNGYGRSPELLTIRYER